MMNHEEFSQLTTYDVEHMNGELLESVALDKRLASDIRIAAMRRHQESGVLSEILEDEDNPVEVREAAEDILQAERIRLEGLQELDNVL